MMSEPRNRTARLRIVTLLQSILILVLLAALLYVLLFRAGRKESVPVSLEAEETTEAADIPVPTEIMETEVYYDLNGKKILLRDSAYGEIWIPVLESVPACSYDLEQVVTRNSKTYYLEDDTITSRFGVDVSAYQNTIDWGTAHASGVDFAIIRAGYRGYGSGVLVEDERYHENMEGALNAGVDVGVYFFSQAISVEEAIEEAEMVIDLLEGYDITYPVVYDWEIITTDSARTDSVSVETLTDCTIAFCDTIAAAGYTPMVYQNKRTSLLKLDLQELTDYDFWLAEYNDEATYYYHYDMWQYSSEGSVPGITGAVDLNICFKDYTGVHDNEAP